MHFDPNTGEKIMDPGDEIQATAENSVNQAQEGAAQAQADAAQANNAAAQQAAQNAAQFQQAPQFEQAPQFQQVPPATNTVKKGMPIGAVIGIVAAVLVIIGAVAFFATRGLGAKVSLLNTITNAYNGEYLTDASKGLDFKPFSDMTVKVEVEMEDVEVLMSIASEASSHTRSVYSQVTYDGFTIDATAYIDEKQILASCPIVGDYLFKYDYSNNKNSGYIVELLEEEDIEVSDLNALIAFLNDNSGSIEKFYTKSVAYFTECVADLDFKKTGNKETFKVNGDKVECKEYQVVITEETIEGWISGYQKIVEDFVDSNSDLVSTLEDLVGEELDIDEIFDDLIDEIDGVDDVQLSIFTKGNTTAAIRLANEDENQYYEIQLKGGDYLAQNVDIIFNDDGDETTLLTISGKTKGDTQTTTIEAEGDYFTYEYSYNKKTGELEMSMEEWGREVYSLEATLTFDKNSYTMDVESISAYGQDLDLDKYIITVSNKAEIVKPKGEEFDLGNADEDEFEDLAEDIFDELQDNDELMELMEELDDLSYYF